MAQHVKETILHLIDTGGPGGAETIFLRVAAGLEQRGSHSIPVVSRDAWLADQLRQAGLEPVILGSKGSLNIGYLRQLTGLIRQHRPTAILTHLYGSAIYGALAGRLAGRPVVSVMHGHSDIGADERLGGLKARIVAGGASRLVAVSTPLREALARTIRAPAAKWSVIPNGVDTATLSPGKSMDLRSRLGVSAETPLIGALGNIRRPKAYEVFLRTAARLAEASDRFHFVIGGEGSGPLMDELLAQRRDLGLDQRIHFLGLVDDIPRYLGDLDIFLLTSSTEGFSIACVEAMACGLPVVATRSGGPEDIVVDGETGFLCPAGDCEALAERIAQLANDEAKRESFGLAGRHRVVTEFSLNAMLDAYDAVLQTVVHRKAKNSPSNSR